MSSALGENVWVFHAGALGDHVMIWPLVRALARQGARVTVVAAGSHARLCEGIVGREVGAGVTPYELHLPTVKYVGGSVRGVSAEQRRFTRMWLGSEGVEQSEVVEGVGEVLTFVASGLDEAGRRWIEGARAMFPGAAIRAVGVPGTASRAEAWERAGVERFGQVASVRNPNGPVVLFAGAGGDAKRWPVGRWRALAEQLRSSGWIRTSHTALLAGPVEAERWSEEECIEFRANGGEFISVEDGLDRLAARCRAARLFIGCDTGPTHLAAQLGVRTGALFGPTDPAVWRPAGPEVRVLAPKSPRGMDWLEVAGVAVWVRVLLMQGVA